MGSMFMVVVPIRDYEVILRQKEHNIRVLDSEAVDIDDHGQNVNARPSLYGSQKDIHVPATMSRRDSFNAVVSTVEQEVDVYTAISDGQPARIVLSGDSMTIVAVGDSEDMAKLATSTGRKSLNDTTGSSSAMNIMGNIFLEKHLEECLMKYDIMSAAWDQSVDGNFSQVSFTVKAEKTESIINKMRSVGIGTKYSSTMCVCSAAVYYEPEKDVEIKKGKQTDNKDHENDPGPVGRGGTWNQFVASIKSRLTVAQVVQAVQANAIMTFDFIILIIVAGCIAGLGLIDDSSVNVVASMLVSPLMGPIMALTFGTVIQDMSLIRIGLLSEVVGLLICLTVGVTFGIILQTQPFRGPWADVTKWPTDQMRGRSQINSLFIGIMVAIPSGAGVALSILAGNSGSLVGVAISASLLPPAVNCGIFWGMALVIAITERVTGGNPLAACDFKLKTNYTISHTTIYCDNEAREYALMGIVSFGLTWLNIILIFLVGVVVLKIKEVAPHTTRKSLNRFWKQDLKAAREYNQSRRHSGEGTVDGLIDDLDESGDKEEILNTIKDDNVFNTVNRRTGFLQAGNILSEVQRSKVHSTHLDNDSAPHGGINWLGWFGSSKKVPEPNNTDAVRETETGKRYSTRPKLQ